jgi:GMP synthase PP-ATPase subunit
MPEEILERQPFPGPAVRIVGEVTAERGALLRKPTTSSSRKSRTPASTARSGSRCRAVTS